MIEYGLAVSTAATSEPVTLAEAKSHLRVVGAEDDDWIEDQLIPAARQWCEEFTGRQFVQATYDLYLDSFPSDAHLVGSGRSTYRGSEIRLPRPPLSSVTSITYLDGDGASQTLSSALYRVDTRGIVGSIAPVVGQVWPDTYDTTNAVTVRFVAGYSSVPPAIKQAVLIVVATLFEHREAVIVGPNAALVPFAAKALLYPFRVLTAA